jgi:RNA polymerase sigma-70 factor (ECF subfamily)
MGLAYRMTGSLADAEDALQEAYIRWQGTDLQAIRKPRAFLSTMVTRLCIDRLKSARARRESYVGPWLPEPVLDTDRVAADDATELAQDVSVALMMALERLSPLERAAFLLHDVFDYTYAEVASALDRSEAACRQLASRARAHVKAARPRYEPSDDECERIVLAFGAAVMTGDLSQLRAILAEDATLYADGGGRVRSALRPVRGADRVARFFLGVSKKYPLSSATRIVPQAVNGTPGFVVVEDDRAVQTLAFDVREGLVHAVYAVRNPDKLARLRSPGQL